MATERTTIVDFVARGETPDEWQMILVEEGPWEGPIVTELRRVQDRLYGCLDAAIDGQLAQKFPESRGKQLVIRLNCYNVPKLDVAKFFDQFSKGVLATPDYKKALDNSKYLQGIRFEVTFDFIH